MKIFDIFLVLILLLGMNSCSTSYSAEIEQEVESPNGNYIATVEEYYFYSDIYPVSQEVYISDINGDNKSSVLITYGYQNEIEWVDDSTLKIKIDKIYSADYYEIEVQEDEWNLGDVKIIYQQAFPEEFNGYEDPKTAQLSNSTIIF
ncbi:MAG: hypothetical protein R2876_03890 [Eubacteriales bacterium]